MRPSLFEPESLRLSDFHYNLPDSRIAKFPLRERDQAKLLVYRQGEISHRHFCDLPGELPHGSLIVGNNTRVIHARLHFFRKTGAHIEIFLLHPHQPADIHQAMEAQSLCVWQCMIGNKKKWKEAEELELGIGDLTIKASWHDRDQNFVQIRWNQPSLIFAELIHQIGELPLPPYLNREATEEDHHQYQTVYAQKEGAVAAPTAGLHFTPAVLQSLSQHNIGIEYLTLHVGAGTFQPVKQEEVWLHEMHSEQMRVSQQNLERLLAHKGPIIPIGTTSMRVLESLYWIGVQVAMAETPVDLRDTVHLDQHMAYQKKEAELPSSTEALSALLTLMRTQQVLHLTAETRIFIVPGYTLRMCDGLITNFHLPETTLLLLIAALVGDQWKTIYQSALDQEYRFLSYGDSSLLLPE